MQRPESARKLGYSTNFKGDQYWLDTQMERRQQREMSQQQKQGTQDTRIFDLYVRINGNYGEVSKGMSSRVSKSG